MTPFYDVISAYPLMAQGSVARENTKMAMSLKGRNRHYHWARIQPRHFLSTAQQVGFSAERAKTLIADILDQVEPAINSVEGSLPEGFPSPISDAILEGVRDQAQKLQELQAVLSDYGFA